MTENAGDVTESFDSRLADKQDITIDTPRPAEVKRGISKRIVVIIVVLIVVGSAGLFVWLEYLRPWSIKNVVEQVINDPSVGAPGFSHSLAGRTVAVRGEITNITPHESTFGHVSMIELDHFGEIHLVAWGDTTYELGKSISMDVSFEWSVCNNERHVLSPQLDFPNLATLPSIAVVADSISYVAGTVMLGSASQSGDVTLNVFDVTRLTNMNNLSCELRAGEDSFASEYVGVMGITQTRVNYGRGLEAYDDLHQAANSSGMVRFNDMDNDGNLSCNDSFTIKNLPRPEADSGFYTYALVIRPARVTDRNDTAAVVYYIIMTHRGVLRFTDGLTPYARATVERTAEGIECTMVRVFDDVEWTNLSIMFSDGVVLAFWNPNSGDLGNGPSSVAVLGGRTLGALQVQCQVTDIAGNGVVNEGDYITISAWASMELSPSTNYTIALIYERSSAQMWTGTISG